MKLGTLYNSHASLQVLASTPLKMKVAIRLSLFLKQTTDHIKIYEEKQMEMAEKFGTKSEKGFQVPTENINAFTEAMNEVGEVELDIKVPSISVNDLSEDAEIEASHLLTLHWLFKEEEEKEDETDK